MGRFGNLEKMIAMSMESWNDATAHGLTRIRVRRGAGNTLITREGHRFISMVSCSYLGLDRHPKVIQGAIDAVRSEEGLVPATSRARIASVLVDETEERLQAVLGCQAIATISCSAASAGALPVLASGHFTGGKKPLMIFDKNSHFSMNVLKASCGDETEVVTCEHNDVQFIEDACRTHPVVAYVADGAYSMGGNAPVAELLQLQERYGLFLYFDDSHSLSMYGPRGRGLVRSQIAELPERMMIVASLGKAFGASGGVIMVARPWQRELLDFVGGPLGWSQPINTAGLGAVCAAAEIHLSEELATRQARLREVMACFDALIPTVNAGNGLPIRIFNLPSAQAAVATSAELYRRGFYTSAVFFPIVERGRAGLRAMGRADLERSDIEAFCQALKQLAPGQGPA